MWRIFRLGIKSGNCQGNHTHFRIIGTTCANAECDDNAEGANDSTSNKENQGNFTNQNLASKAAQEHHNFLRQNRPHKPTAFSPINYEPDKLKAVNSSSKEIQWEAEDYLKQRTKVFSSQTRETPTQEKRSISKKKKDKHKPELERDIKLENISDKPFGSLVIDEHKKDFDHIPEDPEDIVDPRIDTYERRLSTNDYGRKMLKLCKERKLKQAIEVLEVEMKLQNIFPDNYCFNVLINGCGKAGYTKKAFELYYLMKKRGLRVQKFTYTGLFNACANSPFKLTEGLELAVRLRKQIKDNEIILHPISYNAMIKAFGHCGDIETAFEIVDEMLEKKMNVTTESINFLLQACVSDKETGFRHALMVWRKMRKLRIYPCIYSYHLLLRCIKECQAGDSALLSQLLEDPVAERFPRRAKSKLKRLPSKKDSDKNPLVVVENQTPNSLFTESEMQNMNAGKTVMQMTDKNEIVKVDLEENMELEIINAQDSVNTQAQDTILPNILSKKFRPGMLVGISSLEESTDRLSLVGGIAGILKNMKDDGVTPTIITFTWILESLPSMKDAEELLLTTMKLCKVVPDVIFCNKLIFRRSQRRKLDEAKEVLELMQEHNLSLDLITFGCLSLGCRRPHEISTLLKDMDKFGVTPSEEIMGSLIRNTFISQEYAYTIELLRKMNSFNMTPGEKILDILEEGRKKIRERMIQQELAPPDTPLTPRDKKIREGMKLFLIEYKNWLSKSNVTLKDHPWAQYGYQKARKEATNRSN